MELQHSFTVPTDVDTAWATLVDLHGVAPCFPGATLTGVDGDDFTGQVRVKVGPVSLQYAGKGRFVERDDGAHRAVIQAHGSDKRGNGTAGATVVAQLAAEGEQVTRVTVDTQLTVTGRPAQFGRGVMQDVGGRIVGQFADQLARQLGTRPEGATPTPAPEAVEAPGPAAQRPAAPRPVPARPVPPGVDAQDAELELGTVVLPVLVRRYGPTLLAVLLAAVVTWIVARRTR